MRLFYVLGVTAFAGAAVLAHAAGPTKELRGVCKSQEKSGACTRCDVAQENDLDLPADSRSVTLSCPMMPAGRYIVQFRVPVAIVPPAKLPSTPFFQLSVSLSGDARSSTGSDTIVLPAVPTASWTWWDPAGTTVQRQFEIQLPQPAAVAFVFNAVAVRYYVPGKTQGDPHFDGKLLIKSGDDMVFQRQSG